jgi:hypothetical protein
MTIEMPRDLRYAEAKTAHDRNYMSVRALTAGAGSSRFNLRAGIKDLLTRGQRLCDLPSFPSDALQPCPPLSR